MVFTLEPSPAALKPNVSVSWPVAPGESSGTQLRVTLGETLLTPKTHIPFSARLAGFKETWLPTAWKKELTSPQVKSGHCLHLILPHQAHRAPPEPANFPPLPPSLLGQSVSISGEAGLPYLKLGDARGERGGVCKASPRLLILLSSQSKGPTRWP